MPNEFIARNGIIARSNSTISGSFFVSGSIGIGTSTPTQKLEVVGFGLFRNGLVGSGGLTLYGDNSSPTGMRLTTAGNLGIGPITNATATLHISGASSDNLLRIDSPASSSILFATGSGRVGIGTNSPVATLHIVDQGIGAVNSLQINNLFRVTGDGQTRWGSGLTQGLMTWDTGRVMIGGVGGNNLDLFGNGVTRVRIESGGNVGIGTSTGTVSARLHTISAGATSATTAFLLQNSTPTNLMTVLDNGQFTISSPLISLAASQSAYVISQSISASNAIGGNYYAVNITPTFFQTTASQTETAFRVAATFTQSSVLATGGTNIIADFGATSVGSQLTVTDITSGSIYMVNDVSGLPIIEATSDWTVNMYNFPNIVLQKTGSQVNINGTLRVSGSFILPLSQSTTPGTGSAYWSGSLLFIWDGTRYRSSSFA